MKKIFTLCFAIFFFSTMNSAQDRPLRVGVKFGAPILVGLNLEYVTIANEGRIAPTLDYTSMNLKNTGFNGLRYNYLELGGNYYFRSFEGKGFYGHLSYGQFGVKGSYVNYYVANDAVIGEAKVVANFINIKVGAKWGNSFYFRPEFGYALLLNTIAKAEHINPVTNTLVQESYVNEIDNPIGGLVFNIGFGFAF